MTYQDLIDKLQTEIEEVTELKDVYAGFPDSGLLVYPCAVILPQGRQHSFLDTRDTRREYNITIRIYGNMENTGVNTQQVVWDITDKVTNVLEKNITLDGIVDWIKPTSDKFYWDKTNSKIYFNEIQVTANVRFNRYA